MLSDAIIEKRYERELREDYEKLRDERFLKKYGFPRSWSLLKRYNDESEYPKHYVEMRNNVVKIRAVNKAPKRKKNCFRGEVNHFSRKSRKRFLEFLLSIDWDKYSDGQVREVTLTYHNAYSTDGEVIKKQLHNFRKHILKAYPGTVIIWKLEYQKRGAPHFHLILITKNELDLGDYLIIKDGETRFYDRQSKTSSLEGSEGLRTFVQQKWSQVTGESIENFNSGVEVEVVRKKKAIAFYLCKYMAKEGQYTGQEDQHKVPEWFENVGRWWGCYGKKELGIKVVRFEIEDHQFNALIDSAKEYWVDNDLPEYEVSEYGVNLYVKDRKSRDKYVINVSAPQSHKAIAEKNDDV